MIPRRPSSEQHQVTAAKTLHAATAHGFVPGPDGECMYHHCISGLHQWDVAACVPIGWKALCRRTDLGNLLQFACQRSKLSLAAVLPLVTELIPLACLSLQRLQADGQRISL